MPQFANKCARKMHHIHQEIGTSLPPPPPFTFNWKQKNIAPEAELDGFRTGKALADRCELVFLSPGTSSLTSYMR